MATTGSDPAQIRTRNFARVLGPFFCIVPTTVAIRSEYMKQLFDEFKANPMWPWLFGAILLMFGLLIIAFHQFWRTPAAIIISVIGWIMLARGIILLTVPTAYDQAGDAVYSSHASLFIWVVFAGLASCGLYLTYVGWKPVKHDD
ncbi:hypothetical protein [Mycobacterium sp. MAA66]|uniref:hypothetical protein n=1 Tax=Mycobacterium sp. MAA66 TaxID=3156297 RepID=UPI003519ABA9